MVKLLSLIFIKNRNDVTNPEVRTAWGMVCGGTGIFLNILLFAGKLIFGILASSVAMIGDALNNLSDAASSFAGLLGFKLSSKKPDEEHPFGHGRIEYIAGLFISFLILAMGLALIKSSGETVVDYVKGYLNPENAVEAVKQTVEPVTIIILGLSILVKFYMFIYNNAVGKKIDSVALTATAKDSLSDMISTFVVIASLIASRYTELPVDGIAGIIVGIFILKTGYEAAQETISPLLGSAPSPETIKGIEEELLKHKPIKAMHDLVIHDYGPGRMMISLHAEVPGDGDIFELHEVIDETEIAIARKFNAQVVIHMDPVDVKNERLKTLTQDLKTIISRIDENMTCHDVRMVPGVKNTNLIFDVVKPFSLEMENAELIQTIRSEMKKLHKDISCVITVDMPFC